MLQWVVPLSYCALILMCLTALYRLVKELRGKRGALSVAVNLNDLIWLWGVSVLYSITLTFGPSWLQLLLGIAMAFYGFLILLDAALFVQFRIEVNRQTFAWFFTGSRGLRKGIPHLLAGFSKFRPALLFPVGLLGMLWVTVAPAPLPAVATLALGIVLFTVFSIAKRTVVEYLALMAALAIWLSLVMAVQTPFYWQIPAFVSSSLLLTIPIIWSLRWLGLIQTPFAITPTLLTSVVKDDSFDANETISLQSRHQEQLAPKPKTPQPSQLHGLCNGANIILITLESMGNYLAPAHANGAQSRLLQRFGKHTWHSQQHYCLCPNTTVSTNQIYTGGYSNNPYNRSDSLFPGTEPRHLRVLQQAGYKTLFLDSADIGLYDYHQLLKRIGFDKIWGTTDLPAHGLTADYRLWHMVDEVAEHINEQPFFLHLINDQTHMPYEVVDIERFNRHRGSTQKDLYLNAVEESDYVIDTFLTRLAEKVDLSNTLLVFTGDHGESFGEFGYRFHSNSVILPQMQVPFFLHHPNLDSKVLAHSCHFDLFPTFFDLLGLECPHTTLGTSLAFDDREFAYLFHSATLKGNTPANFGFMSEGELMWMDRLFNQVNVLREGHAPRILTGHDREYVKTLLYHMLKAHKLIA